MLRLILLCLLGYRVQSAFVTQSPSFSSKLEKLYERLEKVTFAPIESKPKLGLSPQEKIFAKLDQLNSLQPKSLDLTEDDEELLATMQEWGELNEKELQRVMDDLQRIKDSEDVKRDEDDGDAMYNDDGSDGEEYYADELYSEAPDILSSVSVNNLRKASLGEVLVSSRVGSAGARLRAPAYTSPAEHLTHTNRGPIIIDENGSTELRNKAMENFRSVRVASQCLTPQARWLSMRQLIPAADTKYMPRCVQLHRCAPDSGCCRNESEVCAPIAGENVTAFFYVYHAGSPVTAAEIQFYNHTECGCVPIDELRNPGRYSESRHNHRVHRVQSERRSTSYRERQGVSSREGQLSVESLSERQSDRLPPTEEPKLEREETSPPQLRRCTCPSAFLAQLSSEGCTCVCNWRVPKRNRDCLMFARGKEHFGMRDRVCVANGDCHPPTCVHGAYNLTLGKCPVRINKRIR